MKPKYIRAVSDLHLEAFTVKDWHGACEHFLPNDPRDEESILLLAGDISSRPDQLTEFLAYVEPRFFQVLMVPGNHEYYRHNYDDLNKEFGQIQSTSLHSTIIANGNVQVFEQENVRIIFGTLWADGGGSLSSHAAVGHYLNDFRLITKGFRLFTVSDMVTINAIHKNEIENALKVPFEGKTVVMTHHMPSYQLCHPRFGTDCNGGFASHCDKLMYEDWSPSVWVHGHTHDTHDEMIGNTRIICNPAGYRGEWKSSFNSFSPKFIEL